MTLDSESSRRESKCDWQHFRWVDGALFRHLQAATPTTQVFLSFFLAVFSFGLSSACSLECELALIVGFRPPPPTSIALSFFCLKIKHRQETLNDRSKKKQT